MPPAGPSAAPGPARPDGGADGATPDAGEAAAERVRLANRVRDLHDAGDHAGVIRLLRAEIDAGRGRAWMYRTLALTLRLTGAPPEEIARAFLPQVEFDAGELAGLLHAARYLHRLGAADEALLLCRHAARIAPDRPEPYAVGLIVTRDPADPRDRLWAAAGVLRTAWAPREESLRKTADLLAADAVRALRAAGDPAEVAAAEAELAGARVVDLDVTVEWLGDADLDLAVTEPPGTVCSRREHRTAGGGIFLHDGFGPDADAAYERYVCPRGYAGTYLLELAVILGEPAGGRATVTLTRGRGLPHETTTTLPVDLARGTTPLLITLPRGRREVPADVRVATLPGPEPTVRRLTPADLTDSDENAVRATRERLADRGGRRFAAPPNGQVGFQPVIRVVPGGIALGSSAAVSADRRFVRLTLQPSVTEVTDVFNFSFQMAPGANPGGF